jgi:hypothetical protein
LALEMAKQTTNYYFSNRCQELYHWLKCNAAGSPTLLQTEILRNEQQVSEIIRNEQQVVCKLTHSLFNRHSPSFEVRLSYSPNVFAQSHQTRKLFCIFMDRFNTAASSFVKSPEHTSNGE